MTTNSVVMASYHECDGVACATNGYALPTEGAHLVMSFQCDLGEIDLQLLNVAFVYLLRSHNPLSLIKQFTHRAGHSCPGDDDGVTLFCKSARSPFAPTDRTPDQMRKNRARSDSA